MNRYQMVKAIQDNIEWLSTTEGDEEVQCISIENLEAILEIDLKLAEKEPSKKDFLNFPHKQLDIFKDGVD